MRLLGVSLALFSLSSASIIPGGPRLFLQTKGTMNDDEYGRWLEEVHNLHADGSVYAEQHQAHQFFEMFKPTATCSMQRYPPGQVDGGKYVCSADKLPQGCIIYSIGSEGNYLFEEAMSRFGCEIHTFDCFGDYGGRAPNGTTFHRWCVGGRDYEDEQGRTFLSIPSMMQRLGHRRVDYLKMDVEGAEYYAIPPLLTLPMDRRPVQLGLEIHPWHRNDMTRSHATMRATMEIMMILDTLGYRLVAREDNILDRCCSELVYVIPHHLPNGIQGASNQ